MIEFARPAYLWAGAVLASVPLLLHLLRPRERVRKPLPTIRFLTPDPRRRVRIHRRPDHVRLLLSRIAMCAAIGAAFAGPRWIGTSEGTLTIVVVDAGAATRPAWAAVRDVVLPSGRGDRADVTLVRPGAAGVPSLVGLGADDVPAGEAWADLAPDGSAGTVRLAHLIRAVRDAAARSTGADSLAARIVAVPTWGAWGPGVRELRDSLWPGRIELVVPAAAEDPDTPAAGAGAAATVALPAVAVRADAGLRSAVPAALDVLGLAVDTTSGGPRAMPAIVLRVGPEESLGPLWQVGPSRAAGPESDTSAAPGAPSATAGPSDRAADREAFLLLDGRVLPGAGAAPRGTPAGGTSVPLLRAGGRPAAAAARGQDTCEVALPLAPDARIVGSGDLPVLLEAVLWEACGGPEAPGAERAWRALLEHGGAGPPDVPDASVDATGAVAGPEARGHVAAEAVRGPLAGMPLSRWLLALALALGLTELWMTLRTDRTLDHGRTPGA